MEQSGLSATFASVPVLDLRFFEQHVKELLWEKTTQLAGLPEKISQSLAAKKFHLAGAECADVLNSLANGGGREN
jgi:hypothetical protein